MIEAELIEKIGSKVQEIDLDESVVGKLRDLWPDIHFTYCSDDDIGQAKPVYENRNFFLYLVDNSNHCISFTSNHETATGIVVAECEDE
jgi:hypothetical protein